MPSLTLDPLHLIVLLGAIQGVVLAGALATRRRNRTANRLLAVAMLAFSAFLASNVYYAAGLEVRWPQLFGLGYPLPFLFGPLVLLYAQAAADRQRTLRPVDALHFVPFVAVVVAALPVFLMDAEGKRAFYERILMGERTLLMRAADPIRYLLGVGYGVATILFLRRHAERVKESYSHTEHVNLRWLLWLGAGAAAVWLIAVFVHVIPRGPGAARGDDVVSLAVAMIVYAIGYMGLRQGEVYRFETAEYPIAVAFTSPPDPGATASSVAVTAPAPEPMAESANIVASASPPEPAAAARYERSGLSAPEARRIKARLLEAMEQQRPWTNAELTLADLAATLGTTPHKLSEVLNLEVGETFYDFVNGYRVREVQRRISAGEADSRKLLALALDAGFASKSTFNQVFKKHTGRTPTEFRATADR
ncbi:MAG: helix-turn-helix transcriptional regulator [Gemmatimonadetes bacterium]|nr:helix-turn-helix transcriptional regulator [Gemmatimonadota bacterium]